MEWVRTNRHEAHVTSWTRIPAVRAASGRHDAYAEATLAMARYAAGDERAFAEVHGLLAPRIRRLCVRLLGSMEAEDACQEVFLKMHRARASFRGSGSLKAWTYAIARTTCIDRQRRRMRRLEEPTEQARLEGHAGVVLPRLSSAALEPALARLIDAQIARMSDAVGTAYRLMKVEGLSASEAALALHISTNAAKKRASRACTALRNGVALLTEGECG